MGAEEVRVYFLLVDTCLYLRLCGMWWGRVTLMCDVSEHLSCGDALMGVIDGASVWLGTCWLLCYGLGFIS